MELTVPQVQCPNIQQVAGCQSQPNPGMVYSGPLTQIYIYIPRTQLTSIFEGQPSKTRPFSIKTRVIWVVGIYYNICNDEDWGLDFNCKIIPRFVTSVDICEPAEWTPIITWQLFPEIRLQPTDSSSRTCTIPPVTMFQRKLTLDETCARKAGLSILNHLNQWTITGFPWDVLTKLSIDSRASGIGFFQEPLLIAKFEVCLGWKNKTTKIEQNLYDL